MGEANARADAPATGAFSQHYDLLTNSHDEAYAAAGKVRPHWEYLVSALDTLGTPELERRVREAQRLIRDNDVTYNIYTDPHGMGRPWALDILPLLIASDEWARIESGLIQRAELLNLLLGDLYSTRSVIKKNLLPPELVFAFPGFLRACDGVIRADKRNLPLYAADLVRSSNGEIVVIAERAQAPSGAGYALENRVVLSQVLPSLFRDAHVHRLRSFFRTLRATLESLAPRGVEEPRVVLLTPGVGNEAYFEHAYLANYLGYTLVQGTDLVVSDSCVWLKTLDSIQRVDVILRRVDDVYCDPLELREDSFLGVPGVVQAARSGNVSIVNPLGSGLLQHPALFAFLPRLARYFLGEDLSLPGVETWWCGDSKSREYVLANMETLVIKPVLAHPGQRTLFGSSLSGKELVTLRERIKAQPHFFAAQTKVDLSTAPVLTEKDGLAPRHVVLRSFAVAEDDTFRVMPGGLTRVSPKGGELLVSNQFGGVSKDTWVLASEPEKDQALYVPPARVSPATRHDSEVSYRVADSLYWVGRYAERAEGLIRLLRVIQLRLAEEWSVAPKDDYCLSLLLRAVTHQSVTYPGFVGKGAQARLEHPEQELLSLIRDYDRNGSLQQTLGGLLQAARSIRDRLSSDTRRVINDIDQQFWILHRERIESVRDTADVLDNLVNALVGLSGLINENMTREQGWRFLEIGRRLERTIHTSSLLKTAFVVAGDKWAEANLSELLLFAMDSLMTYRRRYQFGVQMGPVFDLLIHDETNPRGLGFQLAKLAEHIAQLPASLAQPHRTQEERLVLKALTAVRLVDGDTLSVADEAGLRVELDRLLGNLVQQMPEVSEALTATYFQPDEQPHQLVPMRSGDAK